MRASTVARRNARPPAACSGAPRFALGLWLGLALACGADANDAAPGERPSESSVEQLAAAPAASAAQPSEAATSERESKPAETASSGPLLIAPERSPLEPPEAPPPLPSAELETNRSVTSTEPVDVVVPPGDCRFEYLGKWVRCEHAGWPNVVETDAPDLLSCMRQCLERDDCTAVTDYLWLGQPEFGCYLYTSSCDAPAVADFGEEDKGHDFRRACSEDHVQPLPVP